MSFIPSLNMAARGTPDCDGTSGANQAPLRILLVDDEEYVRTAMAAFLDAIGHNVTEAATGADAVATLRRGPSFDLLITDFEMPGMDGDRLTTEAQAIDGHLPVLMVTGFPGRRSDNGVLVIEKPFRIATLEDAIFKVLYRRTIQ